MLVCAPSGTDEGERGFGLLEALVATALAVAIAFAALAACKSIARTLSASAAAHQGADAVDEQATRFETEAATAFAVFVPAADAPGRPNTGQEVDFYSRADDGRPIFWRYAYDAGAQTLTRSDFDETGAAGVRDVATGAIDPAASYPPLRHVIRFSAAAVSADRLADQGRNIYSGVAGLFFRSPTALPVRYGAAGVNVPAAVGGNGVVQIAFATASSARVVHLAAGAMPTGFTVTGAPVWHAIVYRVDQSHRFLLGVAGKSHVFINAHVDVSYDGWKSRVAWCDFNLLGYPGGLDPHDPHADYKPDEPVEQAPNILAACRRRRPEPPASDSPGNPPDADAIHPPLPGQTAPPCWVNPSPTGRCWPAGAPPGWLPPSPWPVETPPAAWCATHAQSPVCPAGRGAAGANGAP